MNRPLTVNKTAFPCELILFFKGSIVGLEDTDYVYSYYTDNGENYASFAKPVIKGHVNAMAFADGYTAEDEKDVKLGFSANEIVNWGVWRDGIMYELKITKKELQEHGWFMVGEGEIMFDNIIEVNDNLLYYMPPRFKEENNAVYERPDGTPTAGTQDLLDRFRPVRVHSYNFTMTKANNAKSVKSPNRFPRYMYNTKDLEAGEIKFTVDFVPYRDYETDEFSRSFTIKYPAKAMPLPKPPRPVQQEKYQWADFRKEVSELTITPTLVSGEMHECTALLRYRKDKAWVFENYEFEAGDIEIPIDKAKGTLNKCWITFKIKDYKGRPFSLNKCIKF
jgi:hypothetical protein